jgi:hypothetical protein
MFGFFADFPCNPPCIELCFGRMKSIVNNESKSDEQKKLERAMTSLFRIPRSVVAEKIKAKKKKGKT